MEWERQSNLHKNNHTPSWQRSVLNSYKLFVCVNGRTRGVEREDKERVNDELIQPLFVLWWLWINTILYSLGNAINFWRSCLSWHPALGSYVARSRTEIIHAGCGRNLLSLTRESGGTTEHLWRKTLCQTKAESIEIIDVSFNKSFT